jgi:hypothetical protein
MLKDVKMIRFCRHTTFKPGCLFLLTETFFFAYSDRKNWVAVDEMMASEASCESPDPRGRVVIEEQAVLLFLKELKATRQFLWRDRLVWISKNCPYLICAEQDE